MRKDIMYLISYRIVHSPGSPMYGRKMYLREAKFQNRALSGYKWSSNRKRACRIGRQTLENALVKLLDFGVYDELAIEQELV